MLENEIVSLIFVCGVGSLCYWFFFKCVDWFEKISRKERRYVYRIVYTLSRDLRVSDVCIGETRKVLNK